ncbi:hypothetical protein V6Z12_D04G083000 [Gossypium hirsutum]
MDKTLFRLLYVHYLINFQEGFLFCIFGFASFAGVFSYYPYRKRVQLVEFLHNVLNLKTLILDLADGEEGLRSLLTFLFITSCQGDQNFWS